LTSGPVAVRDVEGFVVGVVEGTVVGVVDDVGGFEPVVVGAGDEPVGAEDVGEPLVAVAEGSPPRMGRAPLV
jgi:hypothetical protein